MAGRRDTLVLVDSGRGGSLPWSGVWIVGCVRRRPLDQHSRHDKTSGNDHEIVTGAGYNPDVLDFPPTAFADSSVQTGSPPDIPRTQCARDRMPALLIASTTPGAGKTTVAALLAARFAAENSSVTLAGAAASNPEQIAALVAMLAGVTVVDSPSASSGDTSVVEGASGDTEANLKLAQELDARVVLIAGITDEIIPAASPYGDRLVGVIVNNLPKHRRTTLDTEVVPALEAAGVPFLGAIPEDRHLLAVTMQTISEHLGGEFSEHEDAGDELVDYILIGGMVRDWGVHAFNHRENAAVLVRGDRPDIQMAALATPVKGLILTEGVPPLEHVYYEADQEEIPVTVVPQGTHDAAGVLETLQSRSQFDHSGKLERLQELAADALDFEAIDKAVVQPVTG